MPAKGKERKIQKMFQKQHLQASWSMEYRIELCLIGACAINGNETFDANSSSINYNNNNNHDDDDDDDDDGN